MITTQQLRDDARQGVVSLTFIKRDGTLRHMNCTLTGDAVHDYEFKGGAHARQPDSTVVTVFDVDANGWRCVDVDKIQTYNGIVDYDVSC